MAEFEPQPIALGDVAARQLANATKTAPQLPSIAPRWLVHCLPWVGAALLNLRRGEVPRR